MRTRKPAGERRREIADAALAVIAEQGLAAFTAAAIARQVGVSDAALFRHFPTKEAIVVAAIARVEEVLFAGFPPAGGAPLERLGRFFLQRAHAHRAHPGASWLVGSEELAQAAPPEGVARAAGLRRRSRAFVRGCLAGAARGGDLAAGLGPEEAEVLVIGALLALAQRARQGRLPAGLPERTWSALERLLRAGGGPRPAAHPVASPARPASPPAPSPRARRRPHRRSP